MVPGVVLLDEILAIIRPWLAPGIEPGFDTVKFLNPVAPDCDVAVEVLIAGDSARFSAAVDGTRVVTGTARLAP